MRSAFVFHPRQVSRESVAVYLDRHTDRKSEERWEVTQHESAVLVITLHDDNFEDFEEEDLAAVAKALGGEPGLMTMLDVSGRVDGYEEVSRFVEQLLIEFGGLAQDDNSSRTWTALEVAGDRRSGARRFFVGPDRGATK